ncbi:MAG: hypothetical protein K8U57_02275 [Planctomycetes bacterium]|nr:hypothetical protein [Planctomycetota bacterium]
MLTSTSCSWCHNQNPTSANTCSECGHDAHVARLDCTCPRCSRARRQVARGDNPIPLAGVAEAIAELRRKTTPEGEPTGESFPMREVPHAAVSPKLAAMIQAVDAAMIEEFGLGGFAYTMIADDGIVAARNTMLDGFVVPVVANATPPTPPADS